MLYEFKSDVKSYKETTMIWDRLVQNQGIRADHQNYSYINWPRKTDMSAFITI